MYRESRFVRFFALLLILALGIFMLRGAFSPGLTESAVQATDVTAARAATSLETGPAEVPTVLVADHQTAKDRALEQAMQNRIDYEFNQTPLSDVINILQREAQVPFGIDETKISDEGVSMNQPISGSGTQVPLETVLDRILEPLQLTWIVRLEMIQVTTTVAAGERLETRAYGVQDFYDHGLDADQLIDMLSSTIQPESWDEVGGPGSMRPFDGAIVIRQTRRVHREISTTLVNLKQLIRDQARLGGDADPSHRVVRTYRIGPFSARQLVKAIESTIEPKSWESKGGIGQIFAIEGSVPHGADKAAPAGRNQLPNVPDSGEAIVVNHLRHIHYRIIRLTSELQYQLYSGNGYGNGGVGGQAVAPATQVPSAPANPNQPKSAEPAVPNSGNTTPAGKTD